MRQAKEIAADELNRAARLAKRMFTRKRFRKPTESDRPYQAPKMPLHYQYACEDCARPCVGITCRECFQKRVRAKYEAKTRAEDERVKANEKAFNNVARGINL